jgi:hypothetical protein
MLWRREAMDEVLHQGEVRVVSLRRSELMSPQPRLAVELLDFESGGWRRIGKAPF